MINIDLKHYLTSINNTSLLLYYGASMITPSESVTHGKPQLKTHFSCFSTWLNHLLCEVSPWVKPEILLQTDIVRCDLQR